MKKTKKLIAFLLAVNIILGTLPISMLSVFAAPAPIRVYVDSYSNGTMKIHWDGMANTTRTTVTYHTPRNGGGADVHVLEMVPATETKADITGLVNDYIYDIRVDIDDGASGGRGFIYALTQSTFNASKVDQQAITGATGGTESGIIPTLKVSWVMPKILDSLGNYVYAYTAFNQIDPNVNKLSYSINISDSTQRSDILLNYTGVDMAGSPTYVAKVTGDTDVTRTSQVKFDNTTGLLYFYLLGKKDDQSYLPTKNEVMNNIYTNSPVTTQNGTVVLPNSIPMADYKYVLPHKDIVPGTVYFMTLNTLFTDNLDNYLDVVYFGTNGSPLTGKFNYTYTPLRFELSKDSMDNIYVKIFKINKGTLNLPRLFYRVQTSKVASDLDTSWDEPKTLDDTFFTGSYTYTVISGVSPDVTRYYRIIVTTDGSEDRVESLKMPYTLQTDVSRPPVVKGIEVVQKNLVTTGGNTEKSTDVTFTWDKPANWDQIKGNLANDIYFHIYLSTSQTDNTNTPYPALYANGKFYGNFATKYRLVKYVSANSPNIDSSGPKLKYTLKGFDLFKWEDEVGHLNPMPNPDNYPNFLLPNTVYYMQMYTTMAADRGSNDVSNTMLNPTKMSDKSIITSFTTLASNERDIPLPGNMKLIKTDINQGPPKKNYIDIQFDKVKLDWKNYVANPSVNDKIYYDLYMSMSPETSSFVRIGSTEFGNNRDVRFDKYNDAQSPYITARIQDFSPIINAYGAIDPYSIFGATLKPNTTYYLVVKTRLVMQNDTSPPNGVFPGRESVATAILPVTTSRLEIGTPDETSMRPLAPVDFSIAKDASGNPMLTGQAATFNWTNKEDGVTYNLICTSSKIAPDAEPAAFAGDPIYMSFINEFKGEDGNSFDNKLSIDPAANPLINNFEYTSLSKLCKYSINRWMFPNRLYYFSLRTEKSEIVNGVNVIKKSVWITIPVTTYLIEGPTSLEPVNGSELGFYWVDTSLTAKAADYRIYIKAPADKDYVQLTRSQATIVKDGSSYYARIYNLKQKTPYNIKVYKGANNSTTVYEKTGVYTKDDYHQIEVKWKGPPVDTFTKYEIAIKTLDDEDYTLLADSDLEQYVALSSHTYPYYIEKTGPTVGTKYFYYHAVIKTMNVKLADGTIENRPLKPNTKYFIKVRARKTDPADTTLMSYSKFIGPVDTRTDFSQEDYDDTDEDLKKKASFLDKVTLLEENLFWRMDMGNRLADKILLKGERMVNAIQNTVNGGLVLDISAFSVSYETDTVYMPVNVAQALNQQNKNLTLKTAGAEYTLRPLTLDVDNSEEIKAARNASGSKDVYLKLSVNRKDYPSISLPQGMTSAAKVNDFKIQVMSSTKTDKQLTDLIHDKLYNDKTGLIKEKTDLMSSPEDAKKTDTPQKLDAYINGMIKEVERDMAEYITGVVEGAPGLAGTVTTVNYLAEYHTPLAVKLHYPEKQGLKQPYVLYDGTKGWQKISNNVIAQPGSQYFYAAKPGKYTVLIAPSSGLDSLPDDHWAKNELKKFTSKYDLSEIFPDIKDRFNPDTKVSIKEMVLLYEKVLNKTDDSTGLDFRQRLERLGLDRILDKGGALSDISREQAAAVLMKLYSANMGVNVEELKPSRVMYVEDEDSVEEKYYKSVMAAIDMGVLSLDETESFNPASSMTRAEVITAFSKLMDILGK